MTFLFDTINVIFWEFLGYNKCSNLVELQNATLVTLKY